MRVTFINSGILGHRSASRVIGESVARLGSLETTHIDCASNLDLVDRTLRAVICARTPMHSPGLESATAYRWRAELNSGLIARRRLRRHESARGISDRLHFHTQATAYASISRMRRTPSIVSVDASQALSYRESGTSGSSTALRLSEWHDEQVFSAAAAIVSTSQWAAADLARQCPHIESRLTVLPYPIDVSQFDSTVSARDNRRRTGLAARPRVLFVGGDFVRKGGDLLIEAWRDASLGDIADLDLVTDWKLEARLLPSGVHMHRGVAAYTQKWFDLWAAADIFVMPTRSEVFGMVFQEAAAAGLPVIATRINAVPEIVEDGRSGVLIGRDDKKQLADTLRTLLASPERLSAMGYAARDLARSRFDPDVYASMLHNLFNKPSRSAS